MLTVGFEPAIPASERSQTHVFVRAATEVDHKAYFEHKYTIENSASLNIRLVNKQFQL